MFLRQISLFQYRCDGLEALPLFSEVVEFEVVCPPVIPQVIWRALKLVFLPMLLEEGVTLKVVPRELVIWKVLELWVELALELQVELALELRIKLALELRMELEVKAQGRKVKGFLKLKNQGQQEWAQNDEVASKELI